MMATMQVRFWRGLALSGVVLLTLLPGCSALFGRTPHISPSLKTPSTALDASPNTRLGQAITPLVAAHPGRSGF